MEKKSGSGINRRYSESLVTICWLKIQKLFVDSVLRIRIRDPRSGMEKSRSGIRDPDPAFYRNADPEPAFPFNADPALLLIKVIGI
jgi:hypothetical protein